MTTSKISDITIYTISKQDSKIFIHKKVRISKDNIRTYKIKIKSPNALNVWDKLLTMKSLQYKQELIESSLYNNLESLLQCNCTPMFEELAKTKATIKELDEVIHY